MDETTISSAQEGAAPVDLSPAPTELSADDGDRAIENILAGNALPKGDTVAEGEAQKQPSEESPKPEDDTLVITEEDDEPQQTAQAPAKPVTIGDDHMVTLQDGQQISIGELKRNNMFHRDYTFKSAANQKARTDFDTWQKAEVEKLQHNRNIVLSFMQKHMPPRPDRTLVDPQNPEYDPLKYQQQQVAYEIALEEVQALEQQKQADDLEKQKEEQAFQERYEAEMATHRVQQLEMFYLGAPKLRDQATREAFFQDVRSIVPAAYRLDPEELLGLENSGTMLMLYDAIRYRKALADSKKVVQELPAAPKLQGKQRATPATDQQRDASGRFSALRKTGTAEAADLAIEAILSRT